MTYARSNPHRFTTTRAGKAEIDEEFNTQTSWINDASRRIDNIETSGISGADNPANAGKVPVTDGYHISWKKVDLSYLTPQSMNDTILLDRSITNRVMGVHSVGSDQLMDGCVSEQKIPHNSLPGTKIRDGTTSLQKLSPSSRVSVMVGSSDSHSWVECPINPWEVVTSVPGYPRPYGRTLDDVWNNNPNYFDGSKLAAQSIPSNSVIAGPGWGMMPIGSIISYAGPTTGFPGFLTCDGRAVSKTEFPGLFGVIGNMYGSASEDQFVLPDLAGRVIVGITGGSTKNRVTGATATSLSFGGFGGAETHTLTIDQIPPHSHTHNFPAVMQAGVSGTSGVYNGTISASTSMSGGGQPHNNMPPFLLLNYLIKT